MANEYLQRTPTSSGNKKVFTISAWTKVNDTTNGNALANTHASGITFFTIRIGADGNANGVYFYSIKSGTDYSRYWSLADRDCSSWIHHVFAFNTTALNVDDRVIYYRNGAKVTAYSDVYGSIPLDYEFDIDTSRSFDIFKNPDAGTFGKGQLFDYLFVDGQALTPDVFGFYKDGDGYMSSGTAQATDFRPGQWMPHSPTKIKKDVNRSGGFGVNGFYLPMNDSSNPGADFHCDPNSIITLKGEDLPQPRNGAPTTTDSYVSQLRTDPNAANLVLAVPGISTATGANLVTNGTFDTNTTGWTSQDATLSVDNGRIKVLSTNTNYGSALQTVTGLTVGQRYTFQVDMFYGDAALVTAISGASPNINSGWQSADFVWRTSFTATTTSLVIDFQMASIANKYGFWDNVILKAEDAPRDYSADIKGSGTNKTLTANGNAGVCYEIPGYYGSAMTFDGTGDYFTVPNTADLRMGSDDFTIEAWVNKNDTNSGAIFALYDNGNNRRSYLLYTDGSNDLTAIANTSGDSSGNTMLGGSASTNLGIDQWHHCALEREGSYLRLYLNGVVAGIATNLSGSLYENTDDTPAIGTWFNTGVPTGDIDSSIQDLRVYKGVAKYKGGFDVPKPYTPVGIEAFRTTTDTCSNNFATLNPLDTSTIAAFNGNSSIDQSSGGWHSLLGTHYVRSGKWYAEMRIDRLGWIMFGLDQTWLLTRTKHIGGQTGSKGVALVYNTASRGDITYNGTNSAYTGGDATAATGDIISIALDLDNNNVKFYKNNVLQYNLNNILESGADYTFGVSPYSNVAVTVNFGQNQTFSGQVTAGTNADDSGKGLFKYAPPTGFLALCEDNLLAPAIADPGKHFKSVLYAGDGADGRGITGVGFKPDFVWVKSRINPGTGIFHTLVDSVRRAPFALYSNSSDSEDNPGGSPNPAITYGGISSFDNDGFSIMSGSGDTQLNNSGTPYVAWCWKAGGAAVSNSDGSITSQVSVNQDAGFSIVSYTGNNTAGATFGHGLGKSPGFIIVKRRDSGSQWNVWNSALTNNQALYLNLTNTVQSSTTFWNDTTPTSSVITLGTDRNVLNGTYVAYCWAEIEGYSKFGSYVGNASADGPFVYCGFKPTWVMVKITTGSNNSWVIYDSSRNSTNMVNNRLRADLSNIEDTHNGVDFLSNGFKLRDAGSSSTNASQTYIFMAFAESPFQTANAK